MYGMMVRVDASGRVVVPRDLRVALGIPDGGELRLMVRDGVLQGVSRQGALRRIQAEMRAPATAAGADVDGLLAARRAEAARGLNEMQAPPPEPPVPEHG